MLNFLVKQLLTIHIESLSKCVVHLDLIIMFKPKYIIIFKGPFFSVLGYIASDTSHFYSGFSVNAVTRLKF